MALVDRSSRRPGQATTMSTPLRSAVTWRLCETPPKTVVVVRPDGLGQRRDRRVIWVASSRVGSSTRRAGGPGGVRRPVAARRATSGARRRGSCRCRCGRGPGRRARPGCRAASPTGSGTAESMPCAARQRTSGAGTPSSSERGDGGAAGLDRDERRGVARRSARTPVLVAPRVGVARLAGALRGGGRLGARGGAPAARVAERRRGRSGRDEASGVVRGACDMRGPFQTWWPHRPGRTTWTSWSSGSAGYRASGDRGASLGRGTASGHWAGGTGPPHRAGPRRGGDHRGVSATRHPVMRGPV